MFNEEQIITSVQFYNYSDINTELQKYVLILVP